MAMLLRLNKKFSFLGNRTGHHQEVTETGRGTTKR